MLAFAAKNSDFRRWDRFTVSITIAGRQRQLLWDGSRPLNDAPFRRWSLRLRRNEVVVINPEKKQGVMVDAGPAAKVIALTNAEGTKAHVEVRRLAVPAAAFSPRRAATPSEALAGSRFHVYCGSGDTLLADRSVGTLFRGAVDEHEVLILQRRGPQAFVYTKVEGLMLQTTTGRVITFPPGRRFEVAADVVERGVFRWERYWWRVASVVRG